MSTDVMEGFENLKIPFAGILSKKRTKWLKTGKIEDINNI